MKRPAFVLAAAIVIPTAASKWTEVPGTMGNGSVGTTAGRSPDKGDVVVMAWSEGTKPLFPGTTPGNGKGRLIDGSCERRLIA